MTFLPIVGRELRVAARRPGTYWGRFAAALGAIGLGVFMQVINLHEAPHEFAKFLFGVLSGFAMIYCLLSGVLSTADSLSEEKREGTLGLLFLTDLKGYDVVFGKLAATSVRAFYGLMAFFPVMAVPLLMGGITNGEFWRMTLVLVNAFLLSLASGIVVSSMCKSARKAMGGTFCIMLFFTALIPAFITFLPDILHLPRLASRPWLNKLWLGCPFYLFGLSFDQPFKAASVSFWWSAGVLFGLTILFLAVACLVVPRSWQDKPAGSRMASWRDGWHRWSFGDAGERNAFRKRLLDVNAFYWLAGRARLKPMHVWASLGLIACFWTWGCLEVGRGWFNEGIYILTTMVMNTGLKFWVASEAGRQLGEARKTGALELFLSTPLTVREILRGQWLALRRQFLPPLLAVLVIELVFMAASMKEEMDSTSLSCWIAGILMLVLDVIAVGWVAMWVALTTRNPNRTTAITVARVLVLPWVAFIGTMLLLGSLAAAAGWFDNSGKAFVCLWFLLGIAADVVFGLNARWHLLNSFRAVATERFTPPKSFWARLLGLGGRAAEQMPAPRLPPVPVS